MQRPEQTVAGTAVQAELRGGRRVVQGGTVQQRRTPTALQVIQGALDMATKTAESAMTPIDKVWAAHLGLHGQHFPRSFPSPVLLVLRCPGVTCIAENNGLQSIHTREATRGAFTWTAQHAMARARCRCSCCRPMPLSTWTCCTRLSTLGTPACRCTARAGRQAGCGLRAASTPQVALPGWLLVLNCCGHVVVLPIPLPICLLRFVLPFRTFWA